MKTIGIFTTTRAEFGLYIPLIKEIEKSNILNYKLFVGGTHLEKNHGNTINEIKNTGFIITATFKFLSDKSDSNALLKSLSIETNELARIFGTYEFDTVCVLGDRYELIPIIQAAQLYNKTVIHIHGGEQTEGAIDEQIRHMISKAAHIHFPACDEYAQNIRKLGEASWRICISGALAVDNMKSIERKSKNEIFEFLGLKFELPVALMTFHPETVKSNISIDKQVNNIFEVLSDYNIQLVITSPNADTDRDIIHEIISDEINKNFDYHYFNSLGMINYHSLLPHCSFVIGNSSSGIIEVPFYNIPTINIGDRQKGRIRHKSILDTDYSIISIKAAIAKAMEPKFRSSLKNMKYEFGEGNAAKKMVDFLVNLPRVKNLLQKTLDFPC